MKEQSLNGIWRYRIGKGAWEEREVPFSALPVGHSECERTFDLAESGKNVFLRFEGITYSAKVTLNGEEIGEMLPYSRYTFDITEKAREKDNTLLVELEDISPAFGPTEGWENYGGIIRGVSVIYREKSYIEDVFFRTELKNGYKDAEYITELTLGGEKGGDVRFTLSLNGEAVDSYTVKSGESAESRYLKNVSLWSPERPVLYRLCAELLDGSGNIADIYTCNVGFREFACGKHRFMLNGKEIFLQGVCKHEFMGAGKGHTVDPADIERDLLRIKSTGCNFVRLVHYPHCKETIDIADRIGIMVSEEPGLWWSDTADPQVSGGSLEVLRRTVLRDRNHPSIIFWLSFNECRFTEQFLIDSAKVCRAADPTRLVSGANCMNDEDTLKYYNICGFDFYTMHPYSRTVDRGLRSAEVLNDKPLMFTEWGGYHVYDNPHLISDFIHEMYRMYKDECLAGASFWYWSETKDYGRGGHACVDGILKEALVDINGNPTGIYSAFCEAWQKAREEKDPAALYSFRSFGSTEGLTPFYCIAESSGEKLLSSVSKEPISKLARMRGRRVAVGPVLRKGEIFGCVDIPYILKGGENLVFGGRAEAETVTVIGAVGACKGYPVGGAYGEDVARVEVMFTDGSRERIYLRNGIEITTVLTSIGSSRILPRGERAVPFAELSYDTNFENYLINRTDLPLSEKKEIDSIKFFSLGKGYDLLIYGVFAK